MPAACTLTSDCIFCRILRGELPSSRVCEDTLVAAFLDISPVNPGHTLVVPLRHVASLTDLTPGEAAGMARMARQIAAALKGSLPGCEGVTLSMADGEIAGQEVPHAHMHVIPRHAGDGFGWRRTGSPANRTHLEEIARQLRNHAQLSADATMD